MRFKPVNLGFTDCPVGKLYSGSAFPLSPAAFAVRVVQIAPDVYASACRNRFGLSNLAEELKFHHELLLLRYTFR